MSYSIPLTRLSLSASSLTLSPTTDSVAAIKLTHANGTTVVAQIDTTNNYLDMQSHKIVSLLDPTLAQDAATKNYVDTSSTTVNTFSGAVSIVGTTNQVSVSNMTGTITLSTPQNIATSSSPTFTSETLTATTNQLVLGTTNTVTISSTAPAASRTYTIPDASTSANFIMSEALTSLSATGQVINSSITLGEYNGGNSFLGFKNSNIGALTKVGSAYTGFASITRTFPDFNGDANICMDQSNYTIAGAWSFTSISGLGLPRVSTTQKNAIPSPTGGLVVYDTTLNKLCVYSDGTTTWQTVTSV